jgi:phage repressor protein C with HTH and peptisase S24 domain
METSTDSFYARLSELKKDYKLKHKDLGDMIDMTGEAFRMAVVRKSLSKLEISKLEEKFLELKQTTSKKGDGSAFNKNVSSFKEMSVMMVPFVSQYAHAGYLSGFGDEEFLENLPKVPWADDVEHRGEYICIEARGDSMTNDDPREAILDRDLLLCRNVRKDFWKSKLHINKWDFVIVHKELGITVKRIIKHDVDRGIITLHALNDMYDDFEVDLRDVSQILNVVDIKRHRSR